MKIAFFGTPDFAAKTLLGILQYSQIDCSVVVSQPDKSTGRKQTLTPTPVKQVASLHQIEVIQPDKIKNNREFHEYLRSLELDFIVVVAYGKIIPQVILDIPKYGCINIHGSILPKYRGASPVQAAVKNGDTETGLTTMYMSRGMDEGDILKIGKIRIDNVDTSEDIFQKFIRVGPKLLLETLEEILSGQLVGTPQDHFQATYCGKISREDGEVSFQKQPVKEVYDTYRAYTPWPGIYTYYGEKRLVLEEVVIVTDVCEKTNKSEVGECIKISKNRYGVVCADGELLELLKVKLEGKKSMDMVSFVNGNREVLGYVFS